VLTVYSNSLTAHSCILRLPDLYRCTDWSPRAPSKSKCICGRCTSSIWRSLDCTARKNRACSTVWTEVLYVSSRGISWHPVQRLMAGIGYTALQEKGELFGIKNLFAFHPYRRITRDVISTAEQKHAAIAERYGLSPSRSRLLPKQAQNEGASASAGAAPASSSSARASSAAADTDAVDLDRASQLAQDAAYVMVPNELQPVPGANDAAADDESPVKPPSGSAGSGRRARTSPSSAGKADAPAPKRYTSRFVRACVHTLADWISCSTCTQIEAGARCRCIRHYRS